MVILANNVPSRSDIQVKQREEQIKKIFKEAENDGESGGGLNKKKLKHAFRQLGSHFPSWRAHRSLRRCDVNKDGVISGEETNELIKYALAKYGRYKTG